MFAMVPVAIAHTDLELQIQALDQQLANDPHNEELLLRRGDLYRRHEDFELAAQDFEAVRGVNPANSEVNFYQGRLALETGHAEQAQVFLSSYVQSDPRHAAAWVMLGRAELQINLIAAAAQSFDTAIGLSEAPSPELYRLKALALVADNRAYESLQAIDVALEQWPGQVNLVGPGCDIALAQNLPGRAQAYLDDLPSQLLAIDRWRERANRIACLLHPNAGQKQNECLAQSRRDLQDQINHLTQH